MEKILEVKNLKISFRTNNGTVKAVRDISFDLEKGRTGSGAHTRGRAVDIRCRTNATRMKVVVALLAAGFSRIGIADTFIHADDDETLTQDIIWLY